MNRILAAADYSPWSHYAVERAAQLARAHGAALDVVHVPAHGRWPQGSGVLGQYFGAGDAASVDDERARLAQSIEGVARRFRVTPECHVLPGRPADEIASFAAAREADLVAIGTRGHGRLRPQAVGGTALKVLWQSLVPVLLVRQPADDVYRRVVVGTDLGERSRHVCRRALDAFPKAAVTFVHAFRAEHETMLQMTGAPADVQRNYVVESATAAAEAFELFADEVVGEGGREVERVFAHSHPMPTILKAATEMKADVVVLGKHAGPRWEERILGSVVQNLVQQLKCDVLIVP